MNRRNDNKFNRSKYLSKEERQQIRKKKNRVYKINYLRLGILLFAFVIIAFLLIFGISKAISYFSKDNKNVETVLETQKETIKEYKTGETSKKIEKIKTFLKNKDEKLNTSIQEYLTNNKLDKNKINIVYSKINDENSQESGKVIENEKDFVFSEKDKLPLNNANIFIIYMIAEDMEREGKLDLNTIVEINNNSSKADLENKDKSKEETNTETGNEKIEESESEKEQSKSMTLFDLLNDMIKKPETWKVKLVLEYIEKASRSDWKTYANKFYKLSINTQNEMPVKEIIDIFKLAFKKDDGQFRYRRTVDSLIRSSQANKDLYYIETKNFMGFIGVYEFSYTMEIAYVMGEKPYVYLLQTDYSDKSINTELRNMINDWHKLYN